MRAIVVLIKLSTVWLAEFDSLNLQFTCTLVHSALCVSVAIFAALAFYQLLTALCGPTFAAPRNCDFLKLCERHAHQHHLHHLHQYHCHHCHDYHGDGAQLFCNRNVNNFLLTFNFSCIRPLAGASAALVGLTCVAAAMTRQRYSSSFPVVVVVHFHVLVNLKN